MLKQFAVAYRWEHSLPLGDESEIRYGMGATIVRRICMRNKNAVPGKWYVEERNVVEDFKRAFGRLPEGSCGLTIGANSQYSKSNTLVEIDFIEFCAGGKEVPLPLPEGIKTAERKDDR